MSKAISEPQRVDCFRPSSWLISDSHFRTVGSNGESRRLPSSYLFFHSLITSHRITQAILQDYRENRYWPMEMRKDVSKKSGRINDLSVVLAKLCNRRFLELIQLLAKARVGVPREPWRPQRSLKASLLVESGPLRSI